MKPPSNILLVEDDHNECTLFGVAADKANLNITLHTVTDGEQAVDYLKGRGVYADRVRHPVPDLVVLDLDMCFTRGLDFLHWRRASAAFLALPVVIFSAFAHRGTIATALAMGANGFVAKSLEFEGWEAAVRQICGFVVEWSKPMKPAFALGG